MGNDFQKKEPTKNERMIYELAMNQQHMERSLWSTSAHVVALGLALGADPAKVAELLVNGDDKIKEYSKVVNDKIQELEKAKQPADKVEPTIDTEAPTEESK
jgi:hypothetical protein